MSSQTGILRKIGANFSSLEDVWLFSQIFLLVTILPIMLKLLSIPRLMKVLTPRDGRVGESLHRRKTKDNIVRFTDYILGRNFWIYKSTCLKRSLVLYHFLRSSGIGVHVCFGVRYKEQLRTLDAKRLEGHAWLLYNGNVFPDKNTEIAKTYKMIYCFPEIDAIATEK
ncbi:MAG: lasso peptide biosynthesis B2 protein [Deltaproteobacteria bacterium]|nr:lasso peptide biosynthesis B2 protein [Deltaproteobacteria bacterium]